MYKWLNALVYTNEFALLFLPLYSVLVYHEYTNAIISP